ncbi:hypothetical protein N752_05235 [Desulforamulus aquiferis]|nr:hypothetical protein N752_05235 [Desulforamulus aquiferis]
MFFLLDFTIGILAYLVVFLIQPTLDIFSDN